ncbi:hypothetical protein ACNS7O_04075 [Haloferacaceae archaeon DSL9]
MDPVLATVAFGVVGVAASATALFVVRRSATTVDESQTISLRSSFADVRSRFLDEPAVTDVHIVNTHEDGRPIYVPVVFLPLAAESEPDRETVYDDVATVLEAIHPRFADSHVRNYDIVFEYGAPQWGGLVERERRRVAVTPDLATRVCTDAWYVGSDLRVDIETRDCGDDGIPPVLWGEPKQYDGVDYDALHVASTTTAVTGGR